MDLCEDGLMRRWKTVRPGESRVDDDLSRNRGDQRRKLRARRPESRDIAVERDEGEGRRSGL